MTEPKYTVYILYSKSLSKHYIGYTSVNLAERIRRHNTNHKGFTGRAQDWDVIYSKIINDKKEALQLEKKIKARGAGRYLEDLR